MFLFTNTWVIFKSSYPSLTQPPSPHHLIQVHSTLFTTLKLICDVEIHLIDRFNVASQKVSRAITWLAMTNADFAVEINDSSFVFSGAMLGWTAHTPIQKLAWLSPLVTLFPYNSWYKWGWIWMLLNRFILTVYSRTDLGASHSRLYDHGVSLLNAQLTRRAQHPSIR